MDARQLIEKLKKLGLQPRAYSGRGMYGKECVGAAIDGKPGGYELPAGWSIDSLGMGYIVYWMSAWWPTEVTEPHPEADPAHIAKGVVRRNVAGVPAYDFGNFRAAQDAEDAEDAAAGVLASETPEQRELNDKIDAWHNGAGDGKPLHEFLGMTREEFARRVAGALGVKASDGQSAAARSAFAQLMPALANPPSRDVQALAQMLEQWLLACWADPGTGIDAGAGFGGYDLELTMGGQRIQIHMQTREE